MWQYRKTKLGKLDQIKAFGERQEQEKEQKKSKKKTEDMKDRTGTAMCQFFCTNL